MEAEHKHICVSLATAEFNFSVIILPVIGSVYLIHLYIVHVGVFQYRDVMQFQSRLLRMRTRVTCVLWCMKIFMYRKTVDIFQST